MDLRFERPATAEGFAGLLARIAPLPWSLSGETGILLDANLKPCATIDPCGERPDDVANAIAALVMVAVNTCGGFACAAPDATQPHVPLRRERSQVRNGMTWKPDEAVILIGSLQGITLKQADLLCGFFSKSRFIWGWQQQEPIPDDSIILIERDCFGWGIPIDKALAALVPARAVPV